MNELTLDGKIYVSSKQAAEMTGYAKDYVGQLCREGRVEARLVGRNWYVLKSAIEGHRFGEKPPIAMEKEQQEASSPWKPPRYSNEPILVIPGINKLEEAKKDSKKVVEGMQETWKQWFSTSSATQEVIENNFSNSEPHKIELKTLENISITRLVEPRSTKIEKPVHIRISEPDPVIISESFVSEVKKGRPNRVLSAVLVVVMLAAVLTAYVGTGISVQNGLNAPLLNSLAGVGNYNSAR